MSQDTDIESSARPSSIQSINPVLKSALSSLDVELETELIRYRRQRSGRSVMPTHTGLGHQSTRKPIDLISLDSATSKTPSPIVGIGSDNTESAPPVHSQTQIPPQQISFSTQPKISEPLSGNISFTLPLASKMKLESPPTAPPNPTLPTGGNLMFPTAPPEVQPDTYLASSEQLLRSLDEQASNSNIKEPSPQSWLNPLTIGLMLLLLLSSATVGYVFINPSILSTLGLKKFWKSLNPTVAQNPVKSSSITTAPPSSGQNIRNNSAKNPPINSNQSKLAPIINGPNLASGEFVELNLNTLSSLKVNPASGSNYNPVAVAKPSNLPTSTLKILTPFPQPTPASPGQPSNLAAAILPPSLQPVPVPQPLSPGINSPFPSANQSRENTRQYYILAKYDGDRSLAAARQIVKNPYLRRFPDGNKIQLATVTQESQAQKLVQQFQKKGISAWIYHP